MESNGDVMRLRKKIVVHMDTSFNTLFKTPVLYHNRYIHSCFTFSPNKIVLKYMFSTYEFKFLICN